MLPPILETIEAAGVPRQAITILIATGIHRPNEGEELVELVGEEIARAYRCVNHFSQREEECRYIGDTRDGIPLYINKTYLDADLKILTGLVEPHFWAGFSGGRKAILPGVSSVKTMRHMHSYAMIEKCMANCGLLEGNVFHEAGLEVAERVGADFLVNATVDEEKRPTGIFAGHYDKAHREAARQCEAATALTIDEPADLAILSGGGYPLDKTFYQAAKPITVAWLALKKGGQSLIVTECSEGLGSPDFVKLLKMARSPAHLLELLAQPDFFLVDQWCAQTMARMQLENRIAVKASGVDAAELRRIGYEPVGDPQAWLDAKLAELGPKAKIVAAPDGPYVYARIRQS
ncbi:MAG: hypothetical protein BWZ10_02076 [candidate division BRC1 bacterium ADurb.BinA364]|nr:MAG: hypothetical protein BWZ10_02076 [candidate division BRC1 bacterium ADurb.BinA364]